jgi:hypothetical protein
LVAQAQVVSVQLPQVDQVFLVVLQSTLTQRHYMILPQVASVVINSVAQVAQVISA